MKKVLVTCLIGSLAFGPALVAVAKPGGKPDKHSDSHSGEAIQSKPDKENHDSPAGKPEKSSPGSSGSKVEIKGSWTHNELAIVHGYVGGFKPKNLPPGLAKQVARGRALPPGWQKKCIRGEIMPVVVFEHCHPLPPELVVKLPAPPPGTVTVAIGGKVVRVRKDSREIIDVFDAHVRL